MSTNNELEKFRQGTPEEIEKKLEEQKKKSLELARDAADIHCEDEEKPLASEIIEDLMKDRDLWEAKARTMIGFNDIYSFHTIIMMGLRVGSRAAAPFFCFKSALEISTRTPVEGGGRRVR